MATQDVAHGHLIDLIPEIRQSPLDATVAPGGVLLGHLYGELLDLLRHGWPPQLGAACAPVELLRDQAFVPAQERVRCGDRGHLCETLAPERVGERREAAFCVCEPQPAAAVGFQDTVFLLQVGDNLLLLTLDPPGEHGEQELEDHGLSSGQR